MRLHFLNYHHNGDILFSKEFMKDLRNIIQPEECFVHHRLHPNLLKDMPFLIQQPPLSFEENVSQENDVYIVTWIGYYFIQKMVAVTYGCSLYSLYDAFKIVYEELGLTEYLKPIEHYIPKIDYTFVEKSNIDLFYNTHPNRKVLISNGPVKSGQAINFDFSSIIEKLSDSNPNIDFIVTHRYPTTKTNVYFTENIIQVDSCDLNEISYLSLRCDIIVGRASGPSTFTNVPEIIFNPLKTVVGFSNTEAESFCFMPKTGGCKRVWYPNFDVEFVTETIQKEIKLCFQ